MTAALSLVSRVHVWFGLAEDRFYIGLRTSITVPISPALARRSSLPRLRDLQGL